MVSLVNYFWRSWIFVEIVNKRGLEYRHNHSKKKHSTKLLFYSHLSPPPFTTNKLTYVDTFLYFIGTSRFIVTLTHPHTHTQTLTRPEAAAKKTKDAKEDEPPDGKTDQDAAGDTLEATRSGKLI